MSEFFLEYGLFLAKLLTFVIGIIVVAAALASLLLKGKTQEGQLIITHLNKKSDDIKEDLQTEILSKKAWKKWHKALQAEKKDWEKKSDKENVGRLFVVRFEGDIRASATQSLRECISAIINIAQPNDEVMVVLESAGGFVHSYGLAASQLERVRSHKLFLTVAIDKCAASGGYLMACVANKILAAPFALIGSIGVVAQLPNFHRLLHKNNIDYELLTAGEYKRTLTMFGENTAKGREKFQEELEETHRLFKEFIAIHRPSVDIKQVATGEHWQAAVAKKLALVDELLTSDDYILDKMKTMNAFELRYHEKEPLSKKLFKSIRLAFEKGLYRNNFNYF